MFVSEYIIKYLADAGVDTVFGITGTAVNMLFVSAERTLGIRYVCPLHEQGASMAADGYSRISGKIGVCIATSGPGATNLITGCAGAYTESIPMLIIVGQAATSVQKGDLDIRYYGFQEFDSVSAFAPFTKYAKEVTTAENIGPELERAIRIAMTGRKGPVLLSIPEDVLYAQAVEFPVAQIPCEDDAPSPSRDELNRCVSMLREAKKPVLLYGGGVHAANAEAQAVELAHVLGCPVLMTYPARDLLADDDACNPGSIGIFGSRSGNRTLNEADLIIGVGCRFDRYAIGDPTTFAVGAKVIAVDIDEAELKKFKHFGIRNDLAIHANAKSFLEAFSKILQNCNYSGECNRLWREQTLAWREKHPLCTEENMVEDSLNPYALVNRLSKVTPAETPIFVDTGLSSAWMGQAFEFKCGQRMMSQFAFSSMGYSLPAAIGACFAEPERRVVCVIGDGSLQMNIQELATAAHYHLNLAIVVVCNDGYGLIQKTQDDFQNGHAATDRSHGVGLPDSAKIAQAYGLNVLELFKNEELDNVLSELFNSTEPTLCAAHIDIIKRITPRKRGRGSLAEMYPPIEE